MHTDNKNFEWNCFVEITNEFHLNNWCSLAFSKKKETFWEQMIPKKTEKSRYYNGKTRKEITSSRRGKLKEAFV